MIARERAQLAQDLGVDAHEVAAAMGAAISRHCPLIAARTCRREKAVRDLANEQEILRGLDEKGAPVHPLVDLLLLMGAAQREGVPRERALAPLDLLERLVGRVAIDRPEAGDRSPTGVLEALTRAVRDMGQWSAQLAAIVADPHWTDRERRSLPALRRQADEAAAAVLRAQASIEDAERLAGVRR